MVLSIIIGNFGLVKNWQISPNSIRARALFVPFGPTPSHTLWLPHVEIEPFGTRMKVRPLYHESMVAQEAC